MSKSIYYSALLIEITDCSLRRVQERAMIAGTVAHGFGTWDHFSICFRHYKLQYAFH